MSTISKFETRIEILDAPNLLLCALISPTCNHKFTSNRCYFTECYEQYRNILFQCSCLNRSCLLDNEHLCSHDYVASQFTFILPLLTSLLKQSTCQYYLVCSHHGTFSRVGPIPWENVFQIELKLRILLDKNGPPFFISRQPTLADRLVLVLWAKYIPDRLLPIGPKF